MLASAGCLRQLLGGDPGLASLAGYAGRAGAVLDEVMAAALGSGGT